MDDRFDWLMGSTAIVWTSGLSYISGSYHAFGNNGTMHPFNGNINDATNNDPVRNILGASTDTLLSLAQATDHLPVTAQYRFPAMMRTSLAAVPSK
jgi:hypothetical protein